LISELKTEGFYESCTKSILVIFYVVAGKHASGLHDREENMLLMSAAGVKSATFP
jgi:hypothetical protein